MMNQRKHLQTLQRVKVGLIGLITVILLIAFASAIMRTATREAPVVAIGAPKAEVVATMVAGNVKSATAAPLAEVGVVPADGNLQAPQAPSRR